jgi:hypothetical protein
VTRVEQKRFVKDLIEGVRKDILDKKSFEFPADWGYLELRAYVGDRFQRAVFPMSEEQEKDFKNILKETNL